MRASRKAVNFRFRESGTVALDLGCYLGMVPESRLYGMDGVGYNS